MDAASKLTTAGEAVALTLTDWASIGGSAQLVTVALDADDEVCILVNGGGTTPSATGTDADDLAVSVADYLQAELMEAEVAFRVWPTCPAHGVGLHAQATDGGPGWWCRTGQHPVAALGSMPPADQR